MTEDPTTLSASSALPRLSTPQRPIIVRLVQWLSLHRLWLAVITVGYLAFTITAHDVMQQPAYWAQARLGSHRSWNNFVAAIAIPGLIVFCLWLINAVRRHERKGVAGAYLAITVALSALFFNTLLCMNIETVHFPQYAILALLLFAMTGGYDQTVIWCVLAALLDEGYQYFVLYHDRRIYMDFNDVLLNTLGAGLGLVMLYAFGCTRRTVFASDHKSGSFWKSKAAIVTGVLAIGAVVLNALGRLRLLAESDPKGWCIALRRSEPVTTFWNHISWGKTFHEVQPLEWIAASAVLIPFYMLLDRFSVPRDKP